MKVACILVGLCALAGFFPDTASAQSCPSNSSLVRIDAKTVQCRCHDGFDSVNNVCVRRPSPPPAATLPRDVIDPRWLAMPGQAARLEVRIEAAANKVKLLHDERDKLRANHDALQQEYLASIAAERVLVQDAMIHSLDLVDALATLAKPLLPPATARTFGLRINTAQALVNFYGHLTTDEEKRQREKSVDTMGTIKNLVVEHPAVFKGPEGERTKSATDATLKIFKVWERHQIKPGPLTREDYNELQAATLDTLQAANQLAGAAMKTVLLQYKLTWEVPFVMAGMQHDRATIASIQQSNRKALIILEDQLQESRNRHRTLQEELARIR
jgi:hypothetical protein